MKIIIVGDGKVGRALAEQLVLEDHDIVMIDDNPKKLQSEADRIDIQILKGNGATQSILEEAGCNNCDLFIATTNSDEVNILCCIISRKLGARHNIARVRNPEYAEQSPLLKDELGLSMFINPEKLAADEIFRILRAPRALKIDVFSQGRVEIMKFLVEKGSVFEGVKISDIEKKLNANILICAIERDDEIIIPTGNDILQKSDKISTIVPAKESNNFFKNAGLTTSATKNVIIIGGGKLSIYLSKILSSHKIKIKIIEQSLEKCQMLAEALPQAIIIHGDGTDHQLLMEQGVKEVDAVIALTNIDEENIILSMFVGINSNAKTIAKVNRQGLVKLASNINNTSSFISVKNITTQTIIGYVRAVQNSLGSNVENMYHIIDNKVEALEFYIRQDNEKLLNIPIYKLKLKHNILIACITRNGQVLVANGNSELKLKDSVIIITKEKGLSDLNDILM